MILRRKNSSTLTLATKSLSKREKQRALRHELLEDRRLLAVGPQLLGIDHNNGVLIQDGSIHNTAPRELTFRFDEGQVLDRATLSGIRLVRSGFDGVFNNGNDVTVNPAYLDLGQTSFSVVMRFNETLVDDMYRVQIVGQGTGALRNITGMAFGDRTMDNVDNGQNFSQTFDLQLGAQVISVVPQPVTRNANGTLTQAKDKIEVYFNNDPLDPVTAQTPAFYRLIDTQDQSLLFPQSVAYDAVANMAVLTFAADLSTATYHLQIGETDEGTPTAAGAVDLGTISQQSRAATYNSPVRMDANGNVIPTDIPDGGVVISAISVVDSFLVSDVNVELNIDHTWGPDLRIFLQGPGGQRVELVRDLGSQVRGGQIYGVKYNDLDADGSRDAGEPGQAGWTIFIDSNSNGDLDAGERSTVTDSQGRYSFLNLDVGQSYNIVEIPRAFAKPTTPLGGSSVSLLSTDFSDGSQQTFRVIGNPSSGTFRLGFNSRATTPIAFAGINTTTAANIRQALLNLVEPGIGVTVTVVNATDFAIAFRVNGVGTAIDHPAIVVVDNSLNTGQLQIFNTPDASGFTSVGTNNQWHVSSGRGNAVGHSPQHSFYFGANETANGGGLYSNNANGTLRSPEIDLTDPAINGPVTLKLNQYLGIVAGDVAQVRAVVDGQTSVLFSTSASTSGFVPLQLNLSQFIGKRVSLEFNFQSNATGNAEGWYIDDVRVDIPRPSQTVFLGTGPQQQVAKDVNFGSTATANVGPDGFGYQAYDVTNTAVVYQQNFESGTLGPEWTTSSSTANGRVGVSNTLGTPAHSGSFHLAMDTSVNGINNLNEAILTVDLSGVTEASLSFWQKDSNDEENALPATFTGSFDGDGVAISADGTNWFTLVSPFNSANDTYGQITFDLGAAARANNIALGPNFRIKFQQFDNFAFPTDGRSFDDIQVSVTYPQFEDITTTGKRILQQLTDVGYAVQVGNGGDDVVSGMARDAAGNLVLVGSFQGTVDFDPSAGSAPLTSAGGNDVFVAKYAADGTFMWVRKAGGVGSDVATAVAIDNAGNVVVSGSFSSTADIGGTNLISNGSSDAFLWKLSGTGTTVWSRGIGGSGIDEATGVDTLANGDVVATGYFSNTVDFDPGAGVQSQTSAGSTDAFVLRLTAAAGNFTWVRQMGGSGADRGEDVNVTAAGNITTTGSFTGLVDFNPGNGTNNLISTGNADGFIQQLTGTGNYRWAQAFGAAGTSDRGNDVTSDAASNVFVTGVSNGDVWVRRLTANGATTWTRTFGGTATDIGESIDVAADGTLLVAGSFRSTVNFGGGNRVSAGGSDGFVLSLNGQGTYTSVNVFGGTLDDSALAAEREDADSYLLAGNFRNTLTIDAGTSTQPLTSNGGIDAFFARVASVIGLDDGAVQLTATDLNGFQFNFYGTNYTDLYISSNGLISFAAPNASSANTDLLAAPADPVIAAFWEDLRTGAADVEAVFWQVFGTGSDQRLVVQWSGVQVDNANAAAVGALDFEAVLYERDGSIQLNYRRVADPQIIASGPETPVGTFTKGSQQNTAIASNSTGNYVVVWQSANQDGDSNGVYGRRYNAAGNPLGAEFQISQTTIGAQDNPFVAMNASGRFVVSWQGAGAGDADTGVFARIYNASGTPATDEFAVPAELTGSQTDSGVGIDTAGNFVVTWSGVGVDDADGIYARRFNVAGQPQGLVNEIQRIRFLSAPAVGSTFTLIHSGVQTAPIAVANTAAATANNIRDALRALSNTDILLTVAALPSDPLLLSTNEVQTLTFNGSPASGTVVLEFNGLATTPITFLGAGMGAATATNIQTALTALVGVGAGNVTVAPVGASDTQFTVTFTGGALAGTDQPLIVVRNNSLNQGSLAIVETTSGSTSGLDFEVTFLGTDGGTNQPLLTHGLTQNGVTHLQISTRREGSNGQIRVNNFTTGSQNFPKLDVATTGEFNITWTSANQDGNLLGVFSKRFDANGVAIAEEFDELQRLVINGPPNNNSNYRLRLGGTGGPTTGNIAYVGVGAGSQNAARIQTALRALPNMGTVTVTPVPGTSNEVQLLDFSTSFPLPQIGTFRLAHRGLITAPITFAGNQAANAAATATNIETALRALTTPVGTLTVVPLTQGANNDPYRFLVTFLGIDGGIDHPNMVLVDNQLNQGTVAISTINDGGKSDNEFIVAFNGASGRQDQPALQLANNLGGVSSITSTELVKGHGSEFQVNVETTNNQNANDVVIRPDGSYFYVWQSTGQDGDGIGVYGKLFAADGSVLRDEFQINTYTQSNQDRPRAGVDAAGNLVVVWRSTGQDGDALGVYGRRLGADGFPLGDEFQIHTLTAGDQSNPFVAVNPNPNGSFVVAWQTAAGGGGIHTQRFDAAGAKVGTETQVSQYGISNQTSPEIARAANGNYVIVWRDNGRDTDNSSGIYGQLYGPTGTAIGAEFTVSGAALAQTAPSVSIDATGNFVVVWRTEELDAGNNNAIITSLRGRRYDATGNPLAAEFVIATNVLSTDAPDVDVNQTTGDFVVVWHTGVNAGTGSLVGRVYDASGNPKTAEVTLATDSSLTAGRPRVALRANGQFMVVRGIRSTTNIFFEVSGQLFASDGTALGSAFAVSDIQSTTNTISTSLPDIVVDSSGKYSIVWTLFQVNSGNYDAYLRQYDASGSALGSSIRLNAVTGANALNIRVSVAADDALVATWVNETTATGVLVQRINAEGKLVGANTPIGTASLTQQLPAVAAANNGNFIATWLDNRLGVGVVQQSFTSDLATVGIKAAGPQTVGQDVLQIWVDGAQTDFVGPGRSTRITRFPQSVGRLFAVDATNNRLLELHSLTGATLKSYPLPVPAGANAGLAYAGGTVYYIPGNGSALYELDPDNGGTVDVMPLSGLSTSGLSGLAYLNGEVVLLDATANQLIFIDPFRNSETRRVTPAVAISGGLVGGGSRGTLFAFDATSQIVELSATSGSVVATLPSPGGNLVGLALVDGLLLASNNAGSVYQLNPSTGAVVGTLTAATGLAALGADGGGTVAAAQGGNYQPLTGTILDDEADLLITEGVGPYTGRYRPVQPLSLFDGTNARGSWRLEIQDTATGNTGVLNNWRLLINEMQDTPADVSYVGFIGDTTSTTTTPTNDVDLYRFDVLKGGQIAINVKPQAGLDAVVRLFDAQGNPLALVNATGVGGGEQLVYTAPNAGTYFVGVSSAGNAAYNIINGSGAAGGTSQGSYSLAISFSEPTLIDDNNSSFDTATPIGVIGVGGQTVRSEVRSGPYGPILPGGIDEPGHRDIPPETHLNATGGSGFAPQQIILRFEDGVTPARRDAILADQGLEFVRAFDFIGAILVKTRPGADVMAKTAALDQLTEVRYATPDYLRTISLTPDDPLYSDQWHYNNQGQTGGTVDADIDLPEAWDTFTGSNQTVIAILDTGVDYNHPDLRANMWLNPGEIAGDGIDNDGNGYIDDIYGIDPGEQDTDPMDNFGHGTHVAGTTSAVGNNGIGVTGVNWNSKIMSLKVGNANAGIPDSAIIEALNYIVTMKTVYGINIVVSNNSYGGEFFSQAEMDAIAASITVGVVFVAAAGNGDIFGNPVDNDVIPQYPASYNLDGIISVAATDHNDQMADFSNFGVTSVDIAAPGVDVLSTTFGGGYGLNSGTSMASPHVAGVVALLAGFNPAASVDQLKSAIMLGADPLPNLTGSSVSGSRLNAAQSLALLGTGVSGPSGSAITTAFYNFQDNYGTLPSGATAVNAITENQKQRAREVFEMYSQHLGIQFIETANEGLTVITGDLRAIDPTVPGGPGGVAGISEGSLFGRVIMDAAENWGDSEYGGGWFQTAMHEIGHSLGLGHAYDLPNLTIMGGFGVGEPVFPGDADLIHGKYLYNPASLDQDLYKFSLNEDGMFTAETFAERIAPNASLLDTVITIYRETAPGKRVLVASNDDYFSNDSYLHLQLQRGTYYIDVSSSGNSSQDPAISDTGFGGTSQGDYELQLSFTPDIVATLVDTESVALDGDADGKPGGKFDFYFESGPTIFVDKMADTTPGVDGNGTLAAPLDNIFAATEMARSTLNMPRDGAAGLKDGESFEISDGLNPKVRFEFDDNGFVSPGSVAVAFTASMNGGQLADAVAAAITATVAATGTPNAPALNVTATSANGRVRINGTALVDVSGSVSLLRSPSLIRILGNGGTDGNPQTLADNRPYLLGMDGNVTLKDGATLQVPQGVTVMVDAGALFKLREANFDVGTSLAGVDRSHGALQILGKPNNQVSFYSYRNDTVGGDSDGPGGAPNQGDWGGLVFRADSDSEREGIFLNWVNNATIVSGGGKLLVGSVEDTFTPIHLIGSRPSISNNTIRRSADAAISADPASFSDADGRLGPDVHSNLVIDNSINGLFVRIRTQLGATVDKISIPSRWDDTDIVHVLTENLSIEATPGGPIKDPITGVIKARLDGSLKIDPGVIVKLAGARIETLLGGQLIAEGTAADPIVFTTLTNDAFGGSGSFDTKNDRSATSPAPGQWGGLVFNATALGSLDHVLINYAGGLTPIEGGFDNFNALEIHQADVRLTNSIIRDNAAGTSTTNRNGRGTNAAATVFVRGAQPTIVNNVFRDNVGTVIHINANSLQAVRHPDPGRSTGTRDSFDQFADNYGPLVRLNRLQNNTFNGMEVRSAVLTTESVWDDTDIAHILRGEISVLNHHTFSGLHLLSSESESLVVKLAGANAGFTANGTLLDIDDRIGGSIYIGASGRPVVLTSLADDTATAGIDVAGQPLGDTNNNGPSTGTAGDWSGILLDRLSNDRNVSLSRESEPAFSGSVDSNRIPADAQFLGNLAPNEKSGDVNRRLGFEVHGNISVDNSRDMDIYSFSGVAGTEVYFDLDQTSMALDSILELIDATGTVLARSSGSSIDDLSGSALPLIKASYLGHDFYSITPRDAGIRVRLPGAVGQTNTYFVRVRSNPAAGDVENINGGLTRGDYKLQIRLRQVDEKPGSFIRGADIRYATNGIQVIGLPSHSPLIGESVETRAGNESLGAAQPLGNLLTTDRNTLSVGGELSSSTDVDWYRFELDYDLIQSIGGFNNGGKSFATVFDIDYADGIARPNTVLSVFDAAGNLVLVSRDSNIEDDLPRAGQGADTGDLSRGSFGTQDAYIGSVHLPAGVPGSTTTYYVAVSSNSQLPAALNGTFTGGASNTLVRLEPISSLQRIAEDHIGFEGYRSGSLNASVPIPPTSSLFDISSAVSLSTNVVPFTLNDVVLYTAQGGTNGLKTVNPFTGTQWTNVGNLPVNGPARNPGDIVMRSDGRLFMVQGLGGQPGQNTAGQLVELDPATGAQTAVGNDGIPDINAATTPPNLEELTSPGIDALAWQRTGNVAEYNLYYSIQGARRGPGVDSNSSTLYRADPASGSAAVAQGQPWGRRGEIFSQSPGDLGRTTGMAFVGNTLYGVSDLGYFYQISLNSGLASNVVPPIGTGTIQFSGLAIGPQNLQNGAFANTLFATASNGQLFALNTSGVLQPVFSGGATVANLGTAPVGLAFSVLDFNLWHPTEQRNTDAGHGINPTFDNTRPASVIWRQDIGSNTDLRQTSETQGGLSFRFGFENWVQNPDTGNAYITYGPNAQYGILAENTHRDLTANTLLSNNYNFPGGALGSLATQSISLQGYAAADKPTLYFNYFLETENQNTITTNQMRDSARVLVSPDGGNTWQLLATNNSILSNTATDGELPRFISPNVEASTHFRQQVQELFDNTGGWRQARVDLSNYAGVAQLQFRFDFTTAGALPVGSPFDDFNLFGSMNDNRRGQNNSFEGFYIDDVIVGFSERGEMVTNSGAQSTYFTIPQNPNPGDPSQILVGQYQLELRRGTEYAQTINNLLPDLIHYQLFDTNTRLIPELFRMGDSNLFRDQGQILIANNTVSNSSQFGIIVDAGTRDAGGSLSRPGGIRNLPTINNDRLTGGVKIENNIVANFGQGGIRFSGDANTGTLPLSSVPFGRIMNNTVYGSDTASGAGIQISENASPTVINNIIANTVSGLTIDATSGTTVVGANLFKGNGSNGTIGQNAIVLQPTDPLFVNALLGNFYLAQGSLAIDSSLNSLADRPSLVAVNSPLGIPVSPILAPERDRFNQLRLDDPAQDPPPGLGSNIFKDRGAVERADFGGPTARLIDPLDNDGLGLDLNPLINEVTVQPTTLSQIVIQLVDQGIGIDDNTVTSATVQVRLDGVLLVPGTDYEFVYNATNNLIILRALKNNGPVSNRYDIRLNNNALNGIRDLASNALSPNLPSGTTDFVLITGGQIGSTGLPDFTIAAPTVTALEDNERELGITTTEVANYAGSLPPLGGIGDPVLAFVTVSNSKPGLFSVPPSIDRSGKLSFVTAADQVGSAVLVMRLTETGVSNPRQSSPQTFTITLTPVNDAPFLSVPTTLDVNEDQGIVQIPNFAVNLGPGPVTALDEVGQTVSIVTTALNPSVFAIQPTIDATGMLRFQTRPDFNSSISPVLVTVQATDDGSNVSPNINRSALKTFTIAVAPINDPPSFTLTNTTLTVVEDEEQFKGIPQSEFPGFATNLAVGPATAIDEASQTSSFSVTTDSPTLFSQQPAIDANGKLTFKTAANRNGNAIVVVQMQDSGPSTPPPNQNTSGRATFTIAISPINDPPEFTLGSPIVVEEDAGLRTVANFASNIRRGPVGADDENSQQVTFVVVADDPSVFVIQPVISIDGTLSFQTALNANSANANFGFSVRLRDNGLATPLPNNNLSAAQSFVINVTPVNDPPVADAFNIDSFEDSPLTISAAAVLVGDNAGPTPDEFGQLLRITQIEPTTAKGGSVSATFDPTDPTKIVSMSYQPALNFVGTDSFKYVVSDNGSPERNGTGTITINVQGINDPPSFSRGADQVVAEDSGVTTVAGWASSIFAGPPSALDELANQSVSFTLTADQPGLFEVQPTVSSDGTLNFKPAKDANGVTRVVIAAIDSGSGVLPNINTSATQTFTITISAINDAPVFTPGAHVTVAEDSGPYAQPWATAIAAAAGISATPATASDEASQTISFEITVDKPGLFAVQPKINGQGLLEFTPQPDAFGAAVVTITAVDNGPSVAPNVNRSQTYQLTVTITPQNDAPVAVGDSYATDEDTLLTIAAPGLLANDTDVDFPQDTLMVVAGTFTSDLGATVIVSADGSMTYDPKTVAAFQQLTHGQSISDTFVYKIKDAAGLESANATVTIAISGVDDPPLAVDDNYSVAVGQSRALDVLVNDSDVDSTINASSIVIKANPGFGTVLVSPSGVITYTPEGGFRGNDSFRYTVKDTMGNESNEAVVRLTVNSAPVASNDAAFTFKGTPVDINVLANDRDIDGTLDATSVQIEVSPSPNGTVTVLAGGVIRFTPTAGFFGDAQFAYSVKDNVGTQSNTASVNVRVQSSRWQNPQGNLDVNADGFVSPIDVLLIINYLNGNGERFLPSSGITPAPYLDPTGDEFVSPLDVLTVINFLNANSGGGQGEGESPVQAATLPNYAMLLTPPQVVEMGSQKLVRESTQLALEELLPINVANQSLKRIVSGLPSIEKKADTGRDDELIELLSSAPTALEGSIDDAIDQLFSGL